MQQPGRKDERCRGGTKVEVMEEKPSVLFVVNVSHADEYCTACLYSGFQR